MVWRLGTFVLQVGWQAGCPLSLQIGFAASFMCASCIHFSGLGGGVSMAYSQFIMFAMYGLITWFGGLELSSCR
jgi:hypothetical protein